MTSVSALPAYQDLSDILRIFLKHLVKKDQRREGKVLKYGPWFHASRPFLMHDYFLTCGNTLNRIWCNLCRKIRTSVCSRGFIEEFDVVLEI